MKKSFRHLLKNSLLLLPLASVLSAADAVSPGKFVVERPTLICLGFEWQIAGDENRNAMVEVSYRRAGENVWKPGMPLFRLGAGFAYIDSRCSQSA